MTPQLDGVLGGPAALEVLVQSSKGGRARRTYENDLGLLLRDNYVPTLVTQPIWVP